MTTLRDYTAMNARGAVLILIAIAFVAGLLIGWGLL